MKVCVCCHDPEIIDDNPVIALFGGSYIIVPEDTPVHKGGGWESDYIDRKVLEDAGLKWEGIWVQPDGKLIDTPYDITASDPTTEAWARPIWEDNSLVIPFLKSRPKNDSTLGSGVHGKRQAQVLLRLFDEHVLGGYDANLDYEYNRNGEYAGSYGTTSDLDLTNPGKRIDLEGIIGIRKAVEEDQTKLNSLGIDPASDDELAKRYCYKLRRSLVPNLQMLEDATMYTEACYGLTVKGMGMNLGLLLGTFASRHQTRQTDAAVGWLYHAMLPIVLTKLIAAGYPDSDEQIEWEFPKD